MSGPPGADPGRPLSCRPPILRTVRNTLLVTVPALGLLALVTGGFRVSILAPVLVVGAVMFLHGVVTKVTVTADRLSVRELAYHGSVDLTDLTQVEVRPYGPNLRLRLADGSGRTIRTHLDLVRADPEIWARLGAAVRNAPFDVWRHDPMTASWFDSGEP